MVVVRVHHDYTHTHSSSTTRHATFTQVNKIVKYEKGIIDVAYVRKAWRSPPEVSRTKLVFGLTSRSVNGR